MTFYSENIKMEKPILEIEFCIKCKWLTRASWIAQELLSTFSNDLYGITIIPSDEAGILEIRCGRKIIWDRKAKKRMPEIKELKQKGRDIINPEKNLGHIDK